MSKFQRWPVEKKVQAGFALAGVFLLAVGAAGCWSAQRSVDAFRDVERTHDVLNRLEQSFKGLLDLEIAVCAADEHELMIVKLRGKRVSGRGSRRVFRTRRGAALRRRVATVSYQAPGRQDGRKRHLRAGRRRPARKPLSRDQASSSRSKNER